MKNWSKENSSDQFPPNVQIIYDITMSGSSLSLDFFDKYLSISELCSESLYQKLKEIIAYVEDYDIKGGKLSKTEPFAAGLYNRGFEFNAK